MNTFLKVIWLLGIAPLVVSVSAFVAWVFWRADVLMAVGILAMFVGFSCIAIGIACAAIGTVFSGRSELAVRKRLVRQTGALIGLSLACFVVMTGVIIVTFSIQTSYTVSIVNQSSLPLTDVQITGGGVQVQVGDIAPGQTAKESFWIKHDGELILQARHGSDKIDTPIEGYVTHNMEGNKLVTLTASNQVKVQNRPPGLWQW